MATSSKGQIALVKFPFSDLSSTKLRPAVVLSDAEKGDLILCQITSNPYADPIAIEINNNNFSKGSLQRVSYLRPEKLFTANKDLIESYVGKLNDETVKKLVDSIIQIIQEH